MEKISQRVRSLRVAVRWSQRELSKAAGVSRVQISRIESGNTRKPHEGTIALLIAALEREEQIRARKSDIRRPSHEAVLNLHLVSDRELMTEVARRYRIEQIAMLDTMDEAEQIDWASINRDLGACAVTVIPPSVRRIARLIYRLNLLPSQATFRFDPHYFASANHSLMPGADRPVDDYGHARFLQRYLTAMERPGVKEASARLMAAVPDRALDELRRVGFADGSRYWGGDDLEKPRKTA